MRRDVGFHRSEAPTLQTAALDLPEKLAYKEILYEKHLHCHFYPRTIVWRFFCVCAARSNGAAWRHSEQFSDAQGKHGHGNWNRNVR
jgi:hypothetical protein